MPRMSNATTPLPDAKSFGEDERSVLVGYLDYHRAILARKAEGINEAQSRLAPCQPSDMTLLGLIRHMAAVERYWFRQALLAEDVPPLYYGDGHPEGDADGDWHPSATDTLAEAFESFWREIAVANRNIAAASLNDRAIGADADRPTNLRRILVHMIEEYARHCGHADLLREAIDGVTGD
jgi:uncharacterized damage-inducible protein DinB